MDRRPELTPPPGATRRRLGRRPLGRRLMLARLGLLVPMIVAAFVLHLSGEDLVILHIVRVALVAVLVVVGAWLRSRAGRRRARPDA